MKKNFKYAFMSAIAFAGAVSFSACSSSDEIVDNPDYNPETNAVKTQFTISLPENVARATRQDITTVQGQTTPVFRGMQDMILVPFSGTPSTSATKALSEPVSLAPLTSSSLLGTPNYHVYSDVTIPISTSAFLFYGQATYSELGFGNGNTARIAPTGENANTAGYTFSPVQIFTGTSVDAKGTALATYVSSIAAAGVNSGTDTWATSTNEGMKALHDNLVALKAGSSASVLAAVQYLYNSVRNYSDELSTAIKTAITSSTYVESTDVTTGILAFKSDITGYPANINLPDGAATLTWSGNTATAAISNHSFDGLDVAGLTSYVYPASLWYRANTLIQTSTSKQTTKNATSGLNEYPSAYTTWDETAGSGILSLYNEATVSPSTRSIVLVNPVQYAVGRLDLTIQCAAATLYDHKGEAVSVSANTFPVTGVLIGGQRAVDFEFANPTGTEYTIYDKTMPTSMYAVSTAASPINYTLVLETASADDVNIAVELENKSGSDFYGYNGQIVPAGTKFYLITKLTASQATETSSKVFKQDYVTKATLTILAGSPDTENNIGLGNAYNVIPDLRTPQLELGLSVDLTWESGHEFTLDF